jgi:uncharacterized membrane protein
VTRPLRLDPRRRALVRIALSFAAGVSAYVVAMPYLPTPVPSLVGWDAGSLALLGLSWGAIGTADARVTRARAGEEDPGRTLVYVIVLLASGVSLLAATAVVRDAHSLERGIAHAVTGLCLATSPPSRSRGA